MDQMLDFSIERLSKPIEELKFDARTYHALKRASIETILDIILLGRIKLVSIKGVGNLMATEISSTVAAFLFLTEDKVFGKEMKRIAYYQADRLLEVSHQPTNSQFGLSISINESNPNQITDFPVEKISVLIDYLGLEVGVIRRLNREGIRTIAHLIATGKNNVLNIRNIGNLIAERIFNTLSKYLGIPEDILANQEIKQIAIEEAQKTEKTPFNISVTSLVLPVKTILLLRDIGITRIEQLIEFRVGNSENSDLINKNMLITIDRALKWYRKDVYKSGEYLEAPVKLQTNKYPNINLNQALQLLDINERAWSVLEMRANQQLTLEEIGERLGGVSRERVRQIISLILEKLQKNINFLENIFDQLETIAAKNKGYLIDRQVFLVDLSGKLEKDMSDSGFGVSRKGIDILISIIRLLAMTEKPWSSKFVHEKWKDFTFLACLVEPPIKKNEGVNKIIEEHYIKNKRVTYEQIAYEVLANAKKPLHWREIAEKSYALNKRENFDTRAIYHALLQHKDMFVRIGQGTYGLKEWGGKTPDTYPDIIEVIFKQENRSLPIDALFSKVSLLRSVKLPSLIMTMEMHPRFYKSINDMYGLREWLATREKQNLRTPEWLIETTKSYARLEREKS